MSKNSETANKSTATAASTDSLLRTGQTQGPCSGTPLTDCSERLGLNDSPYCEDYFQIVRLLGITKFEEKADVKAGFAKSRPLLAAKATQDYLEELIACGMLQADLSKKDGLETVVQSAHQVAASLWPQYQMSAVRNCATIRKPQVCQDIELALVVHYRQCWDARGYNRGELLNSISLAPGEELNLEFFTGDRHRIERERTAESAKESSESGTITSRASSEVVGNVQFKVGVGAHAKVGGSLSLAGVELPIDVNGEVGSNFSSELLTSVTNTRATLNEATLSAANTLRSSQKTRIVEVSEFGAETRSTRKIVNENRCHTVNYDYFEILELYEVVVETRSAEFVARVPLPDQGPITAEWLLCHEHPLRRQLLDPLYEAGFDAAKYLRSADIYRGLVTPAPLCANMGGTLA